MVLKKDTALSPPAIDNQILELNMAINGKFHCGICDSHHNIRAYTSYLSPNPLLSQSLSIFYLVGLHFPHILILDIQKQQ